MNINNAVWHNNVLIQIYMYIVIKFRSIWNELISNAAPTQVNDRIPRSFTFL